MEMTTPTTHDDQPPHPDNCVDRPTFGFNHLRIDDKDASHSEQLAPETDDEDQEDDDDEDGGFTFVCIGDNDSPTTQVLEDGQIQPVFPLFDQTLLLGGDYDEGIHRLPIHVPVDKVFIESPQRSPSSMASGDEETDGVPVVDKVFIESPQRSPSSMASGDEEGTSRSLSKESDSVTPEINMKSNSTGFSKLWRFRDIMNRSNSDGRDAFVFLESPDRTTSLDSDARTHAVAGSTSKVNRGGVGKAKVVKKGSKARKATASAHEVYLKQRGGQTEEERRRSYLPYRPGLMGFFTNVNGGLSRNVHPF